MSETAIGPYRILQKLAAGGMGEVFLCEDPRLGRRVALKRATGSWTESDEGRERLRREARAAAALNHPHIAAVYDVLETEAGPHVVMEFVEGETLSSMIKRGRVPLERALEIGIELADAISAAHAGGVIHRDLKPSNVMITSEGHVKVLDFGLAKHHGPRDLTRGATPLTMPGAWMGTPGYTAPEQYLGSSDRRSDLYSFGAVLYELFTGRRALEGDDPIALAAAAGQPVTPPAAIQPDLPPPVSEVITRLMSVQPAQRPRSAEEVRTVLAATLGAIGDASTKAASRVNGGRRRHLAWVVMAVVIVLVGTATYLRWRDTGAVTASATDPVVLAVLPLENLSGDPGNEFLGHGFAASLITDLSRVPGLTVLSRNAVREVASRDATPARVARELGATFVLAGSVQRSSDRLRVNLDLTRPNGRIVWSQSIEGRFTALLDLQPQLATLVSQAAPLRVGQDARERLGRAPTNNVEALAEYWRGRQLLDSPDDKESVAGAVKAFTNAVRLDPRFAAAHAALVDAYVEQYDLTRDPAWVQQALASSEQALNIDREQPAVWISRALLHRATGRHPEALNDLGRALQLQSNNDDALRLKARVLIDVGRRDEAIAVLKQAIAIRPEYWGTYDALGGAYYFEGRRMEAIAAYQRVTELQPNAPRGYHNLGIVYQEEGDVARALDNYKRAVSITPTAVSYSAIGAIQYSRGEYRDALTSFSEALKLAPNNANIHRNLGDTHARLGQKAQARTAYQTAVALARKDLEVNPSNAVTMSRLAVFLAKLGDAEDAHRFASAALAAGTRSSDVHYRVAVAYALTGRQREAVAQLTEALKLGYSAARVRQDEDLASVITDPTVQQHLGAERADENRRPQ